jgi:hypothetical protein
MPDGALTVVRQIQIIEHRASTIDALLADEP